MTHTSQSFEPGADYAVFYVDNLRKQTGHQIAIVTGETAKQMLANSPDPRRLTFVAYETIEQVS